MPDKKSFRSTANMAYLLVSIVMIVTILAYAEEYIIPFIIALIVWFIIHELRENIQQVPYFKRHMPMWLQSTIGFMIINVVIVALLELLLISMAELSDNMDIYEENLSVVLLQVNDLFGMDVTSRLSDYTNAMDFTDMVSGMLDYALLFIGDAFLIPIYVLFLLIEESVFHLKLKVIYPSEKQQKKTTKFFNKMDKNISRYLTLKTFVSLLTGMLSYFVLIAFGLDGAIFWAMLIFVLNYIPTIGSLIATLFPAAFAVLQFAELAPFLYIISAVGFIQVVVGNIVEPKIMGNSLNISSLVVILSLTIWGAIWGIMGMILSVPITVMMMLVFEEIPALRPVAVLLSERGEIQPDEEEPPVQA